MSLIRLETLVNYWRSVADWATGSDSEAAPKVTIKPSNVMAIGKKTVGSAQVKLVVGASAMTGRRKLMIRVSGDDAVFVGLTGVSVSTGYPVLAGEERVFEIDSSIDLYAIAERSDHVVHIMEL